MPSETHAPKPLRQPSQPDARVTPSAHTATAVDWASAYLAALAVDGRVTRAAAFAGISARAVQLRRKGDAEFAAKESEALDAATATWEAEAIRRAIEGTREPVFYKGQEVGYVLRFSDQILLRLLETRLPHWRQKQAVDVITTKVNPIYGTRAERLAALEKAREEIKMPLG